jgi:hypothetical protein
MWLTVSMTVSPQKPYSDVQFRGGLAKGHIECSGAVCSKPATADLIFRYLGRYRCRLTERKPRLHKDSRHRLTIEWVWCSGPPA